MSVHLFQILEPIRWLGFVVDLETSMDHLMPLQELVVLAQHIILPLPVALHLM